MSFKMPTSLFNSDCFERNNAKLERANELNYDENNYVSKVKVFRTGQNNIVIPTGKLIKSKGLDIRILACISSISYVANCMESGSNTRHISVDKVNKYIGIIAKFLGLKPKKVKEQINRMLSMQTNELELKWKLDDENSTESWFEINYISGEFITLPYEVFENVSSILSVNAFKTYCNLRWLCFSSAEGYFIERAITQEYLLQLIGLSNSSKKAIRNVTNELVEKELIKIRKSYVHEHNLLEIGVTKEVIYYSIVE
ncbi:MAG: hypothetical protein ACLRRH_03980 [Clostridium sp.]